MVRKKACQEAREAQREMSFRRISARCDGDGRSATFRILEQGCERYPSYQEMLEAEADIEAEVELDIRARLDRDIPL